MRLRTMRTKNDLFKKVSRELLNYFCAITKVKGKKNRCEIIIWFRNNQRLTSVEMSIDWAGDDGECNSIQFAKGLSSADEKN